MEALPRESWWSPFWKCHHSHPHSIGWNTVTWSCLTTEDAGKCSRAEAPGEKEWLGGQLVSVTITLFYYHAILPLRNYLRAAHVHRQSSHLPQSSPVWHCPVSFPHLHFFPIYTGSSQTSNLQTWWGYKKCGLVHEYRKHFAVTISHGQKPCRTYLCIATSQYCSRNTVSS